ncbi:Zinc finger protein, partial [Plecturocebus cupreus]
MAKGPDASRDSTENVSCPKQTHTSPSAIVSLYHSGSGTIIAYCNLECLGSKDPPALVSQVARTTGTHHHTQMRSCYIVQAVLKLLGSRDSPNSASQSVEITGGRVLLCHPGQSAVASAHCNLLHQGVLVPQPPQVAGTTGTCHYAQLIFLFSIEVGFSQVDQPSLEVPAPTDPFFHLDFPKCWDYRRFPRPSLECPQFELARK